MIKNKIQKKIQNNDLHLYNPAFIVFYFVLKFVSEK